MVDAAMFFPIASGIVREGHYMADIVYRRAQSGCRWLPLAPEVTSTMAHDPSRGAARLVVR
jgi:hypothetical protein